LTADKYATWINKLSSKSELINIFLDYETFGEHNWKETGIFDFLYHMPGAILKKTPFKFMTPNEIADTLQPVSAISIPSPISWADEERDLTAWLGNELQVAALDKLYSLAGKVNQCQDGLIRKDWEYLQSSDHFYYMATKFFSDGAVHAYFNPYDTPYDAFMNYMNVLSDFEIRLKKLFPDSVEQEEIIKLGTQLTEKEMLIEKQEIEIGKLTRKIAKINPATKSVKKTAKSSIQKIAKEKPEIKTSLKKQTKAPAFEWVDNGVTGKLKLPAKKSTPRSGIKVKPKKKKDLQA
jgi:alpha-amylase